MVDLPDTLVYLPGTIVDLPNTMVDLPNTMVVLYCRPIRSNYYPWVLPLTLGLWLVMFTKSRCLRVHGLC